MNGRKFTGKGDYSDNSIFLPAAGSYQKDVYYYLIYFMSDSGYYWTSTPQSSENYGYKLYFDSNKAETSGAGRDCGNSVRAVLAE